MGRVFHAGREEGHQRAVADGEGRRVNQAIYEKLGEVARLENTIAYSELAPLADLDMGRSPDRAEMGRILGEISTFEHEQRRPMLSAVVTQKDGGPGKGFYTLARELGLMPPGLSQIAFWSQELKRVYDYWSKDVP